MVSHVPNRRHAAGMVVAALIAATSPAHAQLGLDLDLDLGGSSVDVGVGGDGLDLDFDLGGAAGVDVELGGNGLDLDVDLLLNLESGALPGAGDVLSQERALQAVRQRRALPLEDILLRAKVLTDDEVIDARLISVSDTLLYEVKLLGEAGDVSRLYFYARSGAPVDTK